MAKRSAAMSACEPGMLHRIRRGEVYEKAWGRIDFGVTRLDPGRTKLVVRALTKPGHEVMDLKAVRLTRIR